MVIASRKLTPCFLGPAGWALSLETSAPSSEYVGEAIALGPALLLGSDDEKEAAIRLNLTAETGPSTLSIYVDRELEDLLSHPRLGSVA